MDGKEKKIECLLRCTLSRLYTPSLNFFLSSFLSYSFSTTRINGFPFTHFPGKEKMRGETGVVEGDVLLLLATECTDFCRVLVAQHPDFFQMIISAQSSTLPPLSPLSLPNTSNTCRCCSPSSCPITLSHPPSLFARKLYTLPYPPSCPS